MHITVGLRSILVEVLELIGKEMGLVSRKHSLITLRCCLQVLENVSSHVHCRAVILKVGMDYSKSFKYLYITLRDKCFLGIESGDLNKFVNVSPQTLHYRAKCEQCTVFIIFFFFLQ